MVKGVVAFPVYLVKSSRESWQDLSRRLGEISASIDEEQREPQRVEGKTGGITRRVSRREREMMGDVEVKASREQEGKQLRH